MEKVQYWCESCQRFMDVRIEEGPKADILCSRCHLVIASIERTTVAAEAQGPTEGEAPKKCKGCRELILRCRFDFSSDGTFCAHKDSQPSPKKPEATKGGVIHEAGEITQEAWDALGKAQPSPNTAEAEEK